MAVQFIGSEFQVNTTTAGLLYSPEITALADGRFVVTWESYEDGWDIRGRIYNADGRAAGEDFLVNTTTADHQFSPQITALADGGFVVTWTSVEGTSGWDIRGRIYNADGRAAGPDFLVNTTTADHQGGAQITALADGRFVVTWPSAEGAYGEIRGRVYDADGRATGDDFLVNTTTASNQNAPRITALADGRFVVTWRSFEGASG
jgi:hypothetical protein